MVQDGEGWYPWWYPWWYPCSDTPHLQQLVGMRQAPEMPWHRHQAEAHQHRQHEETPGVRRSDAPALEISLDLPTGDQNQQQNHQDEAVDAIEDLRILEGKQAEIRGAWFLLCTLQNCSYKLDLS